MLRLLFGPSFLFVLFACGASGRAPGDNSDAAPADPCPSQLLCGSPASCCASGDECVLGQCVSACPSTTRCGQSQDICCDASEVCLISECVQPGEACEDSFECRDGWYCEPTLERCLPQPEGDACEVFPDNPFAIQIEWSWQGYSDNLDFHNIATTPVVADIDGDQTPEVIAVVYDASNHRVAMLVVLSGSDGSEERTIPVDELSFKNYAGIAVGNLDNDPELEIVGLTTNLGLVALDSDGSILWSSSEDGLARVLDADSYRGYPSLVNVDSDARAEILIWGILVDDDGTILTDLGTIGCNGEWGDCITVAADMNGDGSADIVTGNSVYDSDGTLMWHATGIPDGFAAVADMNLDAVPDVVSVGDGMVSVLDGAANGAVLFGPQALPGGGYGGAPTVADFDGDGRPEFSTAGIGRYTVFDLDCRPGGDSSGCASGRVDGILWENVTQDLSSSTTGSSVFDFAGDGSAEVVYNDECTLYVYDGTTGNIALSIASSTRTSSENPIVADVDGDSHGEIVVGANNDQIVRDGCEPPGQQGITVYGDPTNQWVRTRPIWNQHSYHVTNISASGQVPVTQTPNWTVPGLNNFRQNTQGAGVFNAPDLVLDGLAVDTSSCATTLIVRATVANRGSLGVQGGIPVAFYREDMLIGTRTTPTALLPGESLSLSFLYDIPAGETGPFHFRAEVDGEPGAIAQECNEGNNTAEIDGIECPTID